MSLGVPVVKEIPAPVNYRASDDLDVSCGTCNYYKGGVCTMFDNTPVTSTMVCDAWEGLIEKDGPKYTADPVDRRLEGEDMMRMALMNRSLEPLGKIGSGTLYLIAHAKTRYNHPGQPRDQVVGWKNTPIDTEGRKQAAQLGRFLRNKGIEKIYSSDLRRASQTAAIIGRTITMPVKESKDYRPWDVGSFVGHSSKDVIPKLKPFMNEKHGQPVDGGESFDSFKDRFLPALEKILQEVQAGATVALVSHSRNLELAQGWLNGRGPRKQIDVNAILFDKIDPGVVISVTPRQGGRWALKEIDDVSKGQANPCEVNLRVHGVTRHADSGMLVYRMDTRDGHYVGRTNPTNHRAVKGDILTIQTGDLTTNAGGDIHWMNPNVMSHYVDTAHSWKELNALAAGQLTKDGAGPAGESVPTSDDTISPCMPSQETLAASGPTVSSVHVNKPLKNISIGYMNRTRKLEIKKADKHNQVLYGVVLEPHSIDSQDDFMLPDQVEKAAHRYMKKVARGQATVSKIQHRKIGFFKNRPSVVPVESFIAPVDFSYDGKEMVKKGTWVMALHIEDKNLWDQVVKGEFTGLSIGGTGIRQEATSPPLEQFATDPNDWFAKSSDRSSG